MRRWSGRAVVVIAAALMVLIVFVQVEQLLIRHRAERLTREMQNLQVGKSSWIDVQSFMTRWGRWGDYKGSCSASHCDYVVELEDPIGTAFNSLAEKHQGAAKIFGGFLEFLVRVAHGHLPAMSAEIKVERGLVSDVDWAIGTYVIDSFDVHTSYAISVIVRTSNDEFHDFETVGRQHPTYSVTRSSNCGGCILWVHFHPDVQRDDMRRLTDINFSCITQWAQCDNTEQLDPNAVSILKADIKAVMREYKEGLKTTP